MAAADPTKKRRQKKRAGRSARPRAHGLHASGPGARLRRRVGVALAAVVLGWIALTAGSVAWLRWWPPPTTAFMLASRTADPATGRPCKEIAHRWVPWSAISTQVPRAVLVAEDQRFLQHRGFDTKAIGDALGDFAAGGRLRGASTVSQQVAKNLFLSPSRSPLRKGLEAWFTVWIEALWPKRRIAEVYVNVAQFGPCVFGVEAASQLYFGIPASRVSARQAALLAAVLPAPGRMSVVEPGEFTRTRAAEILAELQRPGGPAYLRGL